MACTTGFSCPTIHPLDDDQLLIVGKREDNAPVPVGPDEAAVIIDLTLIYQFMESKTDVASDQ
jgi:hypothetical protein